MHNVIYRLRLDLQSLETTQGFFMKSCLEPVSVNGYDGCLQKSSHCWTWIKSIWIVLLDDIELFGTMLNPAVKNGLCLYVLIIGTNCARTSLFGSCCLRGKTVDVSIKHEVDYGFFFFQRQQSGCLVPCLIFYAVNSVHLLLTVSQHRRRQS